MECKAHHTTTAAVVNYRDRQTNTNKLTGNNRDEYRKRCVLDWASVYILYCLRSRDLIMMATRKSTNDTHHTRI